MKTKRPLFYLRRKFDTLLQQWKKRENRLPLIIKGARQVGKTETIRHFADESYANFIEINFVERPEFKEIIRDGFSVDALIRNISIIDPKLRFIPDNTLLFFDELQEFPEIATALKFFAQDGRFDVICSGSLLGIQVKRVKSYSVGFQETETMYSLDFEEFLWGCGYQDTQLDGLLEPIMTRNPFGKAVKDTMDRHFLDYCVTGGMPDVLETYFANGTFENVTLNKHEKEVLFFDIANTDSSLKCLLLEAKNNRNTVRVVAQSNGKSLADLRIAFSSPINIAVL